jgi:hypothetical protein
MPKQPILEQMRRKLRSGLRSVAVELVGQAKVRATRHVDQGAYRNSITYSETGKGILFGLPDSPKHRALELGFRPHWVPVRHIGSWMSRHRVGMARVRSQKRQNGSRSNRYRQFLGAGVYVGGPNSKLDYGGGGAMGILGKRQRRWATRGQRSKYTAPGKVGFSVIGWTVGTRLKAVGKDAFLRGYRGR